MSDNLTIINADCITGLAQVASASVQCCVTSPPYWVLRSYLPKGHPLKALEIGAEKTPEEYVAKMLQVFGGRDNPEGIWRVLKDDGTLWLNLGDCYAGGGNGGGGSFASDGNGISRLTGTDKNVPGRKGDRGCVSGLKPKDLCMIPARVALALQAAGWYLRSDIVWAKRNCMPESVTDRPTRSHEFIYLLTKSPKYFYDHEAIKEPCAEGSEPLVPWKDRKEEGEMMRHGIFNMAPSLNRKSNKQRGHSRRHDGFNARWDEMERAEQCTGLRNKRDVWTVATANYPEAHFATFPPSLIRPCIRAGSRVGDTVIDPFGGSGTTGQVAIEEGRKAIVLELNEGYLPLIRQRTNNITPGLRLA